jgi:D-alanine-D-alanine ligase
MRELVTDPKAFGKVAVLMGGWSAEREVSMWSGKNVHEALVRKGVNAVAIDATPELVLGLRAQGFDRVFIVLHGGAGEDGTVQAALELQGLPYTGSGVAGSAIKMDKVVAKRIWKAEGLPTADFAVLKSAMDAKAAARRLGYPFVIKPISEGSSVGVTIVRKPEQIDKAFANAHGEGRAVMAERFIAGAELTVSVLDGDPLPSIRIVPAGEFYDYHAKYIADDTKYHCPSGVAARQEGLLGELAVRAFDLVGASGWGRVDFLVQGFPEPGQPKLPASAFQPWLLEINTVPGMTSHSLVPMAAKARGIGFDELCWAILETSLPVVSKVEG